MQKIILFDLYELTEEGVVTNLDTGRVLKGWVEATGYRAFSLDKQHRKRNQLLHRLLAIAFIPNPTNLPEVNHKDGVKLNNTLSNLEWVTGCTNVRHAFTSGLVPGKKPLVPYVDLPKLVNRAIAGESFTTMALEYGVDPSSLRKLLKRDAVRAGKAGLFDEGCVLNRFNLVDRRSTSIKQYTQEGLFVASYVSMNHAARAIGANPGGIHKAVTKGTLCKGYRWSKIC